jgi:DNA primase
VMVPIEPELSWREALRYSREIAGRLADAAVDCRYNVRATAAIGAFSPRALPSVPIAAPLDWHRLQRGVDPAGFTLQRPPAARKKT